MYILEKNTFSLLLEPFTPIFSSVLQISSEKKKVGIPSKIVVPLKAIEKQDKLYIFSAADIMIGIASCFKKGTPAYNTFLLIAKEVEGDLEVPQNKCTEVQKEEFFD